VYKSNNSGGWSMLYGMETA